MARARNIKPGFFKNEDLAECSPWARLCFAGLWILADRDGRLEDRPKRIKGELFPFDEVAVEPLLEELERYRFIHRYDAGDMRAIQILEFKKHQTPHYSEKASVIKPPAFLESNSDQDEEIPGGLQEDSRSEPLMKGLSQPSDSLILRFTDSLNPEEEGDAALSPVPSVPKAKKTRRGKAPEMTLPEWLDAVQAAGEKAIPSTAAVFRYADTIGLPHEFLHLAWVAFKDRYSAQPLSGQKAKTYADWRLAFLNAVKGNWLKLWVLDGKDFLLTTVGQQARLAMQAEQEAAARESARRREEEPA